MRRIIAIVAGVGLLLTGCGGSAGGSDGAPTTAAKGGATSTTRTGPDDERPSGTWHIVSVQLSRSDVPDLEAGQSDVSVTALAPSCSSGPCDLRATPAGADGTYNPEGQALQAGSSKPEPYTLAWDEKARTYGLRTDRVRNCTTAEQKVVVDAYRVTSTSALTYSPPEGDRPARLAGTYTQTSTATPAGAAKGCTSYSEKGTIDAAPVDALKVADLDLAGEYRTTETVTEYLPAGQRVPGFVGLLGTFTIAGTAEKPTVTGLFAKPAPLVEADGALDATYTATTPCATTPETPDGFRSTETWTDLTPVAVTAAGDPILAGRWKATQVPTPAGTAVGCTRSSNTGYVVMLPLAAIP